MEGRLATDGRRRSGVVVVRIVVPGRRVVVVMRARPLVGV
jgi:hypothetical protein